MFLTFDFDRGPAGVILPSLLYAMPLWMIIGPQFPNISPTVTTFVHHPTPFYVHGFCPTGSNVAVEPSCPIPPNYTALHDTSDMIFGQIKSGVAGTAIYKPFTGFYTLLVLVFCIIAALTVVSLVHVPYSRGRKLGAKVFLFFFPTVADQEISESLPEANDGDATKEDSGGHSTWIYFIILSHVMVGGVGYLWGAGKILPLLSSMNYGVRFLYPSPFNLSTKDMVTFIVSMAPLIQRSADGLFNWLFWGIAQKACTFIGNSGFWPSVVDIIRRIFSSIKTLTVRILLPILSSPLRYLQLFRSFFIQQDSSPSTPRTFLAPPTKNTWWSKAVGLFLWIASPSITYFSRPLLVLSTPSISNGKPSPRGTSSPRRHRRTKNHRVLKAIEEDRKLQKRVAAGKAPSGWQPMSRQLFKTQQPEPPVASTSQAVPRIRLFIATPPRNADGTYNIPNTPPSAPPTPDQLNRTPTRSSRSANDSLSQATHLDMYLKEVAQYEDRELLDPEDDPIEEHASQKLVFFH